MIFKLTELREYHTKESAKDLKKFGFTFNKVPDDSKFFPGHYVRLEDEVEIEINSMQELVDLSEEYGLIMYGKELKLYNYYNE